MIVPRRLKTYQMVKTETGLVRVENNKSNKVGMKVHYIDAQGNKQNGIIKARHTTKKSVFFVVYDCGGDWKHYMNHQGVYTSVHSLQPGWIDEPIKTKSSKRVTDGEYNDYGYTQYTVDPFDGKLKELASLAEKGMTDTDRLIRIIRDMGKSKYGY